MRKLVRAFTLVSVLVLTGCACMQPQPEYRDAEAAAPERPARQPARRVMPDNAVTQDYLAPCCGALRLEKRLPETVMLNQPFEYTITAINLTDQMLRQVVIKEELPEGLRYVSSAPEGELEGDTLTWRFDRMEPSARQTLRVRVEPTSDGWLATCADATYILPACARVQVVNPALELTKSAPAEVILCEPIPLQFRVTNRGTGVAQNVVIRDELAEGLTTAEGQRVINLPVGPLEGGQSADRTVMVRAAQTGTFENSAVAVADGGLRAESAVTTTRVTQPVLEITKSADDDEEYVGRRVEYTVTVGNTGDAVAENTVITEMVPAGASGLQLSEGGQQIGSQASWSLGSLAPGAERRVTISYLPAEIGLLTNTATAKAVCAEAVTATSRIAIRGIPGLLLEVIDIDDPIEVGDNETYVITVTNQGSAVANNIVITNELSEAMGFISAGGATPGRQEGNSVVFEPLRSLAAKAKATWTVVVTARSPGDIRFRTTMDADELESDVIETESTHFYE